ncbi:hypothetical protein FHX42_005080 [Saccharopolyspora lacisalsi]|uniref:GrpE protein n=2 Tax=Halosaccharopolyspora lacisalsi TaxID=1000566 RepID=A0A839E6Z7_9PSEU|nr:hypothetical protein [Halosaccharopolyspora lacisalsi]
MHTTAGDGAAPEHTEAANPDRTDPESGRTEWGADMTVVGSEAVSDPLNRALAERAKLIELCMYALDRARSIGVAERLSEGMDGIGVKVLRPDGERFDPCHHEAAGTVDTDDPDRDGLIAETEVVGFADRDRLVRPPVVTVYQLVVAESPRSRR